MLQVGMKAPQFTLPDKNGNAVSLSDFLGKKVQADVLSKALKMNVKVSRDSKGKGSLTINFKNDEEFERLLDFINKGN